MLKTHWKPSPRAQLRARHGSGLQPSSASVHESSHDSSSSCCRRGVQRWPDTERAQQPTTEENEATVKRQRKSRNQKPSTKHATRGGRHGGGGGRGFQTPGAFIYGEKPAFFLTLGAFRAKSQLFFALGAFVGRVPVDVQACSLASLFPVRGTPWLVSGFGWGFPNMQTTSTHTSSCYTRNRRFCISVWSFLSQLSAHATTTAAHSRSWTLSFAPPVGGMAIRGAPFAVGARADALGITRGRVPLHAHRQRRTKALGSPSDRARS